MTQVEHLLMYLRQKGSAGATAPELVHQGEERVLDSAPSRTVSVARKKGAVIEKRNEQYAVGDMKLTRARYFLIADTSSGTSLLQRNKADDRIREAILKENGVQL
jgi:hypothetical protein